MGDKILMKIKLISRTIFKISLITISTILINGIKVQGAEWQEIEQRGYLIVAVKENQPPLSSTDTEGNLQGLEIDIARRLAQELLGSSNAVKFIPVLNQERLQVVIDDQVDLTIASVTANPSRRRIVEFSPFYYLDGTGILAKKNTSLNQLTSNSSDTIAVLEGSSAIAFLQYNLPQTRLIGVQSYQQGLDLLKQDQVTGLAGDVTRLIGLSQNEPNYQLLRSVYGGYPLAIVMPKGLQYQALRQKVNQVIEQLKQEGWLRQKTKEWGLPVTNDSMID